MSRVDEALRRAASESDGHLCVVDGMLLERYPTEGESARPTEVDVPPVQKVEPRPAPKLKPRARLKPEPEAEREVAELATGDPALDGKLVVADAAGLGVDEYDRLAQSLLKWQSERESRTLMVSSAVAGEGRSLTVANLALMLSSRHGQRVLLVDADLTSPSLHELFGLSNASGLSESLRARRAQLPIVEVSPTLSFVPAGSPEGDAMQALVSKEMEAMIRDAQPRFDWILLDTPPVSSLSDAHLLTWLCDGVLFVIKAGATSYQEVKQAIDDLGPDRLVGTVLNRAGRRALPRHRR